MDTDRVIDVMGLIAGLGGLVVVALAWPRRRRGAVRGRHPSAGAPFSVTLDSAAAAWVFRVRENRPPVAIDIVSHRPAGEGEWTGEPFVEPVVVAPGATATIDSGADRTVTAHDVVVAWTVLHPTGPMQGSRSFRVGSVAEVPLVATASAGRGSRFAFGAIGVFLALITMVLALRALDRDAMEAATEPVTTSDTDVTATTASTSPVETTSPAETTETATSTTSSATVASPPGTTLPASSSPTTVSPATTSGAAITAPNSTRPGATVSPTSAPTTAAPPATATSTTPPDGPQVVIEARVEDCRFGADCVIASFELDGFTGSGEYVCEFADGTRFVFRYFGNGADDACSSSGENPSITIEVDGVRSRTVTREQPGGI